MDMNLLVALDVLLQESSVARAAERLQRSAPAMSRTLARIRALTGDEILVRAGRGLVPTTRALALRDRVRALVEQSQSVLLPESETSPQRFTRTLSVRANDAMVMVLGAQLLQSIADEAPGLVLRFVPEGDEDVAALRDGSVDMDVGVQGPLGPEIRTQTLLRDPFKLLVKVGSTHARGALTPKKLAAAGQVITSRRGRTRGPMDDALEKLGLHCPVRAVVPNAMAAALLVAESDLVTLVPESFGRAAARHFPVRMVKAPFHFPAIRIALAWHPRFDADPAHAWLRQRLAAAARALQPVKAR